MSGQLAELGSLDCECDADTRDICISTESHGNLTSLTTQVVYCRTCFEIHAVLVGGIAFTEASDDE